jgi:hypothetical protein
MVTKFKAAMAKLQILGQNSLSLTDCSDVSLMFSHHFTIGLLGDVTNSTSHTGCSNSSNIQRRHQVSTYLRSF